MEIFACPIEGFVFPHVTDSCVVCFVRIIILPETGRKTFPFIHYMKKMPRGHVAKPHSILCHINILIEEYWRWRKVWNRKKIDQLTRLDMTQPNPWHPES